MRKSYETLMPLPELIPIKESVKKVSTTFTLKDIDLHEIDTKYNLKPQPTFTSLSELTSNKFSSYFSFLPDNKECCISIASEVGVMKDASRMCCFYDKAPLVSYKPIGIPIRYVPTLTHKINVSDMTNDVYMVYSVISSGCEEYASDKILKGYYEIDGVVCSFNCGLAYIEEHRSDPRYSQSEMLLKQLFFEIYKTPIEIKQAGSWRLLDSYGGNMSVQEFRDSFGKHIYKPLHYEVSKIPACKAVGQIFEREYIF